MTEAELGATLIIAGILVVAGLVWLIASKLN